MAEDRFKIEPPGWNTFDELLENLVYYLIENSSYSTLAKEDMPPEMLEEMKKTMEHIANAIWHNVSHEQWTWFLLKNGNLLSTIGDTLFRVNFIEGKGIKIKSFIKDEDEFGRPIEPIINLELSSGSDWEAGRRENLTEYEIRVDFKTKFEDTPVGDEPRIWRMGSPRPGIYRRENVLFYYKDENWLDHTGFNLVIDENEDLEGVILEYEFKAIT